MSSKPQPTVSASSSSAVAVSAPPRKRGGARWLPEVAQPVGAIVAMLVLWELACRVFAIPAYLVPQPSVIFVDTLALFGPVAVHTLATTQTVLLGFAASLIVSLPLAVLITASPLIANSIYPLLVLTQSIPKVALAPILVVIFGSNELPRVVVTFLVAFFPLVLSIAAGITAVPPEFIELGRACKASRWRELWRIRLPYAVPFVFSGLKAAITLSVVGAVVGEFVNADRGLGYLIVTSTAFFKVPLAWGALLLLSLLGIVLFQAVVIIEQVFFPWSVSTDKPTL
jgi:NitT/TauT family transport system permease protein